MLASWKKKKRKEHHLSVAFSSAGTPCELSEINELTQIKSNVACSVLFVKSFPEFWEVHMDCLGILATLFLDFLHITFASMFVFALFLNLIPGLNRLFCPSRVAALSVSLFSQQ